MNSTQSLNDILIQGVNKLGLDLGIVSNIYGNSYTVFTCLSNEFGIKPGDTFELSQTYCSDVIRDKKTKYYKDVAKISEMLKHPCYLNTQLRAYFGTPLILNGEVWGTLNYSSLIPHKDVYSTDEIEFLESQATIISDILNQKNVCQAK